MRAGTTTSGAPRIKGSLLVAGALLASLLATGCTTAGGSADRPRSAAQSAADLAELKRRVVDLQQQARMSEVEIARLRERVAELEGRLEGGDGSDARSDGGGGVAAARGPSAAEPRPEPEPPPVQPHQGAPLLEEIDLETEDAPPAPRTPPPSTGESSGPPVTPEAQQLYDEGYTLYHRGRYLDAEATFQRFLRLYGNTDLGDNAQYWIGESRYARGDLRGALSAFRETIERYSQGNKVPDALVKAGQTLEALGDVEGARETYGEVLRRYPDSPTAAVAREHLDRLP